MSGTGTAWHQIGRRAGLKGIKKDKHGNCCLPQWPDGSDLASFKLQRLITCHTKKSGQLLQQNEMFRFHSIFQWIHLSNVPKLTFTLFCLRTVLYAVGWIPTLCPTLNVIPLQCDTLRLSAESHRVEIEWYLIYSTKKDRVNFHSIFHWRHSLGSDVSDHFFWSEYRVNRTRFHSLSSEFSLYWS